MKSGIHGKEGGVSLAGISGTSVLPYTASTQSELQTACFTTNKHTHTHTCGAQCIGEGMGIGGVRVWPCGADVEGLMGMVEWGWCL